MKDKTENGGLQNLMDIDRVIHEPARLSIMAQLYVLENADFLFLLNRTGLTQGNLSSHIAKLETAGDVEVKKKFVGKKPHTLIRLTPKGRQDFKAYIRNMKQLFDSLSSL